MRWIVLLLFFSVTAPAMDPALLTGMRSVRICQGRVERDFADQTAVLQSVLATITSGGLPADFASPGSQQQPVDGVVLLSLKVVPGEGPTNGLLLIDLQFEVYTTVTTEFGSRGMSLIYRSALMSSVGQAQIRSEAMAPFYSQLARGFVDAWRKANGR